MASLTPLPAISRLSSHVVRVLGCNPGPHTLQGTNSYILGNGNRRILLDTSSPLQPDYIDNFVGLLRELQATISTIILTHWHIDHVGSTSDVLEALSKSGQELPSVYKHPTVTRPESDLLADIPLCSVKDGDTFKADGITLTAYHCPGHACDHLCLVMEEENALFSGDHILGEGTTIVEDMYSYMKSLKRMQEFNCSIIYPAHGPVLKDCSKTINYYISHRLQRENQILSQLEVQPQNAVQLTEAIYIGLSESLIQSAQRNILSHLRKLEIEGRVVKTTHSAEMNQTMWRLSDSSSKL